ncbi:MAG: PilZ domain-containing protein [Spirochaetales bacterium]|nr:PilZ domain-containing protein [Spirochaetales bacterium]
MVRDFLLGVNNQFGATPLIVATALGIITLFLVFLYAVNRIQDRKVWHRRREIAQELYTKLVQGHGISPAQENLLRLLAGTLKEPDIMYPLLMDEHVFNHAVREYCAAHPAPPGLSALRKTIGFTDTEPQEREKSIQSTVQLEPGQIISLTYAKKRAALSASVIDVRADGFLVKPSPAIFLDVASHILVRFFNNRGQYAGACHVRSVEHKDNEELFLLSHCESLTKTQNRKFFRRMYSAACTLTRLGETEHPFETSFVELGGGGASVRDARGICVPGDIVTVDWQSPYGPLFVRGRVVRVTKSSHSGRCVHLEFEGLQTQKQDLLFKILLRHQLPASG